MNILLVGSGAREHALGWAISASPLCDRLICAPGNPGMAALGRCEPVAADDIDGIVALAKREAIDFVVVGPEAPLVAGLVDRLDEAGIKAFGPNAAAAQLEGSKGFMKDLCARANIPTAAYARFTDAEAAKAYIRERGAPIVVKADGLAAGKGVTVASTLEEALAAVDDAMLDKRFGQAGAELVVEEVLEGEELSYFALADGKSLLPLASAQDHKRAFDGDEGPNTGGMGAYSPAPIATPEIEARIRSEILEPLVHQMALEGMPYKGVLFLGLMIGTDGPKLIEVNCRFGDPECEVLMARLESDILPVLIASADGVLGAADLRWRNDSAICVVLASQGYPGSYGKGSVIRGAEEATDGDGAVIVFHAGTARNEAGELVANGGRVLTVTAVAPDVRTARSKAYAAIDRIDWPEGFCRRDIAWRALASQ